MGGFTSLPALVVVVVPCPFLGGMSVSLQLVPLAGGESIPLWLVKCGCAVVGTTVFGSSKSALVGLMKDVFRLRLPLVVFTINDLG